MRAALRESRRSLTRAQRQTSVAVVSVAFVLPPYARRRRTVPFCRRLPFSTSRSIPNGDARQEEDIVLSPVCLASALCFVLSALGIELLPCVLSFCACRIRHVASAAHKW